MSIESAISRVRAFAAATGWAASRYAREAGLGETTLRGFDSDSWNPTADTLRKLEAVIPPGWQPGDEVAPESGGEPSAGDGKEAA